MGELFSVKGYKEENLLRESFNQLAHQIFRIKFETWYQHGFWTEKYQPFSFVDQGKVVFHFHLDDKELMLNNQPYQSSNVLFVKNMTKVSLPGNFKHPITSQA